MDKTVFEPRERGPQEREMRTPSEAEFDAVKDERFSPQIYEKLKRAKVAIAGLGGLGIAHSCHARKERSWTPAPCRF